MGPSVGDLFFSSLEELDGTLAAYRGRAVSFHCEDPVLLDDTRPRARTKTAGRPSAS